MSDELRVMLCACLEPWDEVLTHSANWAKRVTGCRVNFRGHFVHQTSAPVDCPLCLLAESDPDMLRVEDKVPAGTAS